jgi:IclR family transcriptional regulator, acetate operon repressor
VTEERLVGADRVLAVLVELGNHPTGVALDELAHTLDAPKSTVHRALGALRKAGLARLSARGRYELGDEFLRLAFRYQDARPENERIVPMLRELARTFGETAHFAVLDGTDVVYRAKVDPPSGAMRLTSTIGGRNRAWSTAVGKLLLGREVTSIEDLLTRLPSRPLGPLTQNSIVDVDALYAEIRASAERGYGLDNQENEVGVNCLALPIATDPDGKVVGAVSISALAHRKALPSLVDDLPRMREIIEKHLGVGGTPGLAGPE